jgi:hypothetical protein
MLPGSTRVTTNRTSVGVYSAATSGPTLSAEGFPFSVSLRMHAIWLTPCVQSTLSPGGDQKPENGVSHSYTPTSVYVGD